MVAVWGRGGADQDFAGREDPDEVGRLHSTQRGAHSGVATCGTGNGAEYMGPPVGGLEGGIFLLMPL